MHGVSMDANKPLTLVIVDDHPVVRDGLCAMISAEPDIQILAEIGTGSEALELLPKLRPAICLMDLLLPDMVGSQVIQQISKTSSDTAFIVLTSVAGDEEIYRALEAGARGYLLDRKSTRLNSSHSSISYAVFCLKKK